MCKAVPKLNIYLHAISAKCIIQFTNNLDLATLCSNISIKNKLETQIKNSLEKHYEPMC